MNHINNDQSDSINVIIFKMIQEVLHKLENAMRKMTFHVATCLFNQLNIHDNNVPHQK